MKELWCSRKDEEEEDVTDTKLVPREPTQAMDDAASNVDRSNLPSVFRREVWRAMYDAVLVAAKSCPHGAFAIADCMKCYEQLGPNGAAPPAATSQVRNAPKVLSHYCDECGQWICVCGDKPSVAAAPPAAEDAELCKRLRELAASNSYSFTGVQELAGDAAARIAALAAEVATVKKWREIDEEAAIECLTEQRNRAEAAEAERDALHVAISQAVAMMNMGDSRPAHIILRKALVAFADAAMKEGK